MIDTVKLSFSLVIDPKLLVFWNRVETRMSNGRLLKMYQLNRLRENDSMVMCTYFPYTYARKPQLWVEFSIPKMIFGNNIVMVCDIEGATPFLDHALAEIECLPPVVIGEGILRRVDACYNHLVEDAVPYFIKALTQLEYPHRKTKPYSSQGVQYTSKLASTKFYNKEKECGQSTAHGILRQETTLRGKAVKRSIGKKEPTLYDLTPQLLVMILEKDLEELGLLGQSIGTKDTTLRVLCDKEGELAGTFYYGLLHGKTNLSKEMILSATNSHPRSLDRRLKRIIDAGVPLTLTETIEPLPPLVIDMNSPIVDLKEELVSEST